MVRDIPYSETTGDPASVEGRQDGEQSVASHNPCDERGQTSAVIPETDGSAALRVFHCCRSTMVNISSSRSSSSSNAPPDDEHSLYDPDWRKPSHFN